MLLLDSRSKIWVLLTCTVITCPVNLSLSERGRERELMNWFSCSFLSSLCSVCSQRPWELSSLCVHLSEERVLEAVASDVHLITLQSYLVCCSSFLTLFPSLLLSSFYPSQKFHLPLPSFPSDSYPAAGLSRPPPFSRVTTDNVSQAACEWQLSKMAVAAHTGVENPFSGWTGVCPRAHLSTKNQEQRLSVTAGPQSATWRTTW